MRRISTRALNRASLARQMLLARAPVRPYAAIHALAGMQAQAPLAPHVGLWSRLVEYRPEGLDELYDTRRVVRSNLMRATVHLVTTDDAMSWQRLLAPISARSTQGAFGKRLTGIDLDALVAAATKHLSDTALGTAALGAKLAEEFPGYDADALAYGARGRLALVHVPPRGKWRPTGPTPTKLLTYEGWLAREPEPTPAPDEMFLRYLAAFGPASVQDAQAWSGLTRLTEVAERLGPNLVAFRDESGRTLYDLPDAPRPPAQTPAPARFLPEYDNTFFGYADRTRFVPDLRKPPIPPGNGARTGTLLLDGTWRGLWKIAGTKKAAVLEVTTFEAATAAEQEEIEREAADLADFIAGPDVAVQVRAAAE